MSRASWASSPPPARYWHWESKEREAVLKFLFQKKRHRANEKADWRLIRGQEKYLKGVTLKKQAYQPIPPNDHDHCEFCMEKFSANHLTEGYCTPDEKIWICPACYAEFQKQFAWKLEAINQRKNVL